ncbi:hypothetical protein LRS13_04165 [Svornostia abyssi]|uniref:Flagellar protein FliT n=1 Tax=Svornostia abyssi TaxID=2898438 RepID=A0ABY5PJ75_9ACTN|nr:hypothetical protein LRS13_04165 [Parviterribacteraceae bacterium J379]
MDELAPFRMLVTLAESVCAHIDAERWDELAQVQEEFGHRLAELHGPEPAGAGPLLQRAFDLHLQATRGLERHKAEILAELGGVQRGRTAAAGYAPTASVPAASVNHAA